MGVTILLNQAFIQQFLATAFSVPLSYIVLKQGNWFNPQDQEKTNYKTDTWCAFKLSGAKPYIMPYFQPTLNGAPPISTTMCTSELEIQLVGSQAEYMAQSVAHWSNRQDLRNLLHSNGMALSGQNLGDYLVSNFVQDGLNSVLAYNTTIVIQWISEIQSAQTQLNIVNFPTGYVLETASGTLIIS